MSPKEKAKIVKDVSQLVLARRTRMCNFLEYKDTKIVYRRYASLFFIAGASSDDNELITLEIIHRYVEQMDKYYGNVCELDIIFSFTKAYWILDELLLAGELQESSKKTVLRCIAQQDSLEDMEVSQAFFFFYSVVVVSRTRAAAGSGVLFVYQTVRPSSLSPSCCASRHSTLQCSSLTPFPLPPGRGRSDQDHVTQLDTNYCLLHKCPIYNVHHTPGKTRGRVASLLRLTQLRHTQEMEHVKTALKDVGIL